MRQIDEYVNVQGSITLTQNGTFDVKTRKLAVVNFESESKTATQNGVVYPSAGKLLSSVTVDIPVYNGELVT